MLDKLSGEGLASLQSVYCCHLALSQYSGHLFKLRRSGDDAQESFFADSQGNLTTRAHGEGVPVATWLGSAVAYVVTWNDQSGRGRHATQPDPSYQPKYDPALKYVDFKPTAFLRLDAACMPAGDGAYSYTVKHGGATSNSGGVFQFGESSSMKCVMLYLARNHYLDLWYKSDHEFGSFERDSVVSQTYDGSFRRGFVNSKLEGTYPSTGRRGTGADAFLGKIRLNSSDMHMNGEVYYFVTSNMALSDEDRLVIENKSANSVPCAVHEIGTSTKHPSCSLERVGARRKLSARCDVCRSKGACLFFCKSHDWDICSACHAKEEKLGSSTKKIDYCAAKYSCVEHFCNQCLSLHGSAKKPAILPALQPGGETTATADGSSHSSPRSPPPGFIGAGSADGESSSPRGPLPDLVSSSAIPASASAAGESASSEPAAGAAAEDQATAPAEVTAATETSAPSEQSTETSVQSRQPEISSAEIPSQVSAETKSHIAITLPATCLAFAHRFNTIKLLNASLLSCLEWINFGHPLGHGSLSQLLSSCRPFLFQRTKERVLADTVSNAKRPSKQPSVRYNRLEIRERADRHQEVDYEGHWSVFGVHLRVLHGLSPAYLRRKDQLWDVAVIGEEAEDGGGPYRQAWAEMARELMSGVLPLLLPSPKHYRGAGIGIGAGVEVGVGVREGDAIAGQYTAQLVLNPAATSGEHREMFRFLGKLIGIAAHNRLYLEIDLAAIVWKLIVEEPVSVSDIIAIDDSFEHKINKQFLVAEGDQPFTVHSGLTQREHELHPGGLQEVVTAENVALYCAEVTTFVLNEMVPTATWVREGVLTILSPAELRLLSGRPAMPNHRPYQIAIIVSIDESMAVAYIFFLYALIPYSYYRKY